MGQRTPSPSNDEPELDEIEVSALESAGQRLAPRPLPGPRIPPTRSRRARALTAGGIAALVLLLVALGLPPVRGLLGTRLATVRAPTPTPRVVRPPGPTPVLVPSLPAPILAAAPSWCPAVPTLIRTAVPFFGTVIGQPPVYISGLPALTQSTHPRVTPTTYTAYGWQVTLLWAVMPGYTQPVTIRGLRLGDERPLSLTVGFFQAPATQARLDPAITSVLGEGAHWNNWFGTVYVPGAGCYALQAEWPGGSWRIPFAVGR